MLFYLMVIDNEDDRQHFEQVYKENQLKLYYIALKMLKNPSDAENAVQDTFLRLAEKFSKYSALPSREMTALCVTIVKSRAIDMLRRQRNISEDELEEDLYSENLDSEPENACLQKEERAELQMKMDAALKSLPEVYRVVLVLKYYFECSNSEIARLTQTRSKTVEMRLYRAKKLLKKRLLEEGWCEDGQ